MKDFLSKVVLGCFIAVSCFVSSEGADLLKNGSFENTDSKGRPKAWLASTGAVMSSSRDAVAGEKSIKILLTGKPSWGPKYNRGIIGPRQISLSAGTYELTFSIKAQDLLENKGTIKIKDAAGKLKRIKLKFPRITGNSFGWKKYAAKITIPKGMTGKQLRLEFLGIRGKESFVIIDDMALKFFQSNENANFIYNSGFEICSSKNTPDFWHSRVGQLLDEDNYSVKISKDAHSGKNSICLSFNGTYTRPRGNSVNIASASNPDVEKNTKYTLSAYVKPSKPGMKLTVWMDILRKTFTLNKSGWQKITLSGIWHENHRRHPRGSIIQFFMGGRNGEKINGKILIDDIQVTKGSTAGEYKAALYDKIWMNRSRKKRLANNIQAAVGAVDQMKAARIKGRVKIDGKLDEAIWKSSTPVAMNKAYKKSTGKTPTYARVAYGKDALYVALKAVKSASAPAKSNPSASVWSGDNIEFFLDPNTKNIFYYQFVVNPNGKFATIKCIFDPIAFEIKGARSFTADNAWQPEIEYAVKENAKGWSAEIKIPYYLLAEDQPDGNNFKANFYRVNQYAKEINSWTPAKLNFHEIKSFGDLRGIDFPVDKNKLHIDKPVFVINPVNGDINAYFSAKNAPRKISGEVFLKLAKNKVKKLKTVYENNNFTFSIPASLKAEGKQVRILCKQNNKIVQQEFGTVKIDWLMATGITSLVFKNEKYFPISVVINAPEAMLKDYKIQVKCRPRNSGKVVAKKSFVPVGKQAIYRFPVTGIDIEKYYDFDIQLRFKGKLITSQLKWAYLGKQQKNYSRAVVGGRYLELNGKPFFSIAPWFAARSKNLASMDLTKYKKLGFNAIQYNVAYYGYKVKDFDHEKLFRAAEKAGLKVIPQVGHLLARHKELGYTREGALLALKKYISKYKNQPALLMYHGLDEWWALRTRNTPFSSIKDVEDIYWIFKKLDPYHVYFCNLGPRPQAWKDLRHTDLFSYDCYVRAVSPDEFNAERLLYFLRAGEARAFQVQKPYLNVIQWDTGTEVDESRILRPVEQKALTYLALTSDLKSLYYFLNYGWCKTINDAVGENNHEAEQLAPILTVYKQRIESQEERANSRAVWYTYKDKIYLIVINMKNFPIKKLKYHIPELMCKDRADFKTSIMFGNSKISVSNNTVTLNLKEYERMVIELSKK